MSFSHERAPDCRASQEEDTAPMLLAAAHPHAGKGDNAPSHPLLGSLDLATHDRLIISSEPQD